MSSKSSDYIIQQIHDYFNSHREHKNSATNAYIAISKAPNTDSLISDLTSQMKLKKHQGLRESLSKFCKNKTSTLILDIDQSLREMGYLESKDNIYRCFEKIIPGSNI